jgi:helicase MOV-10
MSSPGTGKTSTIVEAMRQLLLQSPNARILACAPSNTAADIIANRLKVLGKSVLFRLNSLSRKTEDLNKDLHQYALVNDNNVFAFPLVEELKKYRVIVSTCITAGVLWGIGFKKGDFSHIFIDEAGHGEEPEIMIPFRTLGNESTNFVLAGDHRQLGPEINSPIARKFELQKSYLKRLMDREIYDEELGRGLTYVPFHLRR